MDWIYNFYSKTGQWWGPAEHKITERDYERVKTIKRLYPSAKHVLELGAGYGNTAAACAENGLNIVAIEISDRADFAKQYEEKKYKGSLKIVKGDFYTVELIEQFDVVTYWNGFGIGTDDDQKKLLKKISGWMKLDSIALIDISNPITWKLWSGEEEHKVAKPDLGYNFNVSEKIDYDETNKRFIDTWWLTEKPEEKITQSIRCYLPTELDILLDGTGLELQRMELKGKEFNLNNYEQFLDNDRENEYLIVLRKYN